MKRVERARQCHSTALGRRKVALKRHWNRTRTSQRISHISDFFCLLFQSDDLGGIFNLTGNLMLHRNCTETAPEPHLYRTIFSVAANWEWNWRYESKSDSFQMTSSTALELHCVSAAINTDLTDELSPPVALEQHWNCGETALKTNCLHFTNVPVS